MDVIQINLHQSKLATAALCQKLLSKNLGVALIQEPWTVKGKVMGLNSTGRKIIYDTECD